MKTTEQERLLHEVLHDENYAAFKAGLFDQMRLELTRQRTIRRRRRWLALAACLPFVAGLFLLLTPRTSPVRVPSSKVVVVRTVPLAKDQIVTSTAMTSPSKTVQPNVLFVTTAAENVAMVRTSRDAMEILTDAQLLDLFRGQPVALVTIGPGERRLILPEAGEQPH